MSVVSKTYNTTPGAFFIEDPELAMTDVYLVKREGVQYDKYISGDPNRTHVHDSALGRIAFPLQFNAGEKVFVLYKKTAPVINPPPVCVAAGISGSMPSGIIGVPYSASLSLDGTMPFTITDSTLPSWMSVAVSGSTVQFSGTPDATGTAGVSVEVENCAGVPATFNQAFNIMPPSINFLFEVANTAVIGGVEGVDLILTSGFPLVAPGSATGYHGDVTGAIEVNILSIVFPQTLRLFRDGFQLAFLSVDGPGLYEFPSNTFLETEELKITLN